MTNNGGPINAPGRGTVTVLSPVALPTSTVTTPGLSMFSDTVQVPNPAAVNNLTVTIALTDDQAVSGLDIVLIAPNGTSQITLVENQTNAAGQAVTSQGLPNGNAIGVVNFTPPTNYFPGTVVGTEFDDNATRDIFDANAAGQNGNSALDYVGTFRPESFESLATFLGSLHGAINGMWTLEIKDFTAPANPDGGSLEKFSLTFSTGMTQPDGPSVINDQFFYTYGTNTSSFLTDVVGGSLTNTYTGTDNVSTANLQGIGPGLVLAEDNTLGPFSPYQGRIYAAFVGYFDVVNDGVQNPFSDTDVFLVSSDNGGVTWSSPILVNNDPSTSTGYSGQNYSLNPDTTNLVTGRSVFGPELAVDQSTGTLVVSWRDAQNDAANARVATYLTTSIDGGNTFGPMSYANPPETAVDAITGATNVIGPAADDESSGNPQTDSLFGYGGQMGLAVSDGQVFPVWAGNFYGPAGASENTDSYFNGAAVVAYPLNIWVQPMSIAAGPRIISSTMGPVVDGPLSGMRLTCLNSFRRLERRRELRSTP